LPFGSAILLIPHRHSCHRSATAAIPQRSCGHYATPFLSFRSKAEDLLLFPTQDMPLPHQPPACIFTAQARTILFMDKLAALTQILTANPNDTFARYGLAMELVSQHKIEQALVEFERCIQTDPDYVPAYQMSAQTLAANANPELAIARLHHGISAANRTGNQHALAEMSALRDELTAR